MKKHARTLEFFIANTTIPLFQLTKLFEDFKHKRELSNSYTQLFNLLGTHS